MHPLLRDHLYAYQFGRLTRSSRAAGPTPSVLEAKSDDAGPLNHLPGRNGAEIVSQPLAQSGCRKSSCDGAGRVGKAERPINVEIHAFLIVVLKKYKEYALHGPSSSTLLATCTAT